MIRGYVLVNNQGTVFPHLFDSENAALFWVSENLGEFFECTDETAEGIEQEIIDDYKELGEIDILFEDFRIESILALICQEIHEVTLYE